LLPELRDASTTAIDLLDSDSQRETVRLYDALANVLRGLASARPLLLVLEDLHWAGSASIDALAAVVKELSRAPVLVIATAREEETPPGHQLRAMLRSLGAVAGVEELHVERLDERDVGELVALLEWLPDRDGELSSALYSYSEGNALFLNEVIWHAREHDGSIDISAATTISSLLERRIAQLGEDARAVAGVAAVAGPGCDIALVREVTNLPAPSVARGFNELLDRRLIREAGARSGYDFVFTHHLIAAATYDGIEPEFRAQRHSRIARILEADYDGGKGGSARDIARHYERSGDAGRAAEWYATAGRQAMAVHAYGDAEDLATHALRLTQSDGMRAAALDVREKARERRADRAGQLEDINALDDLANGEPSASFDVLMRRVRLARSLGETNEEGRLIDELAKLATSLDARARAHALAQRATHLGLRSRQAEGLAPARAALDLYERLGDQRGQLECLSLLAEFSANVGDVAASKVHLATIAERAATLADRAVEARALDVTATAALLRQEYRDCFEMTERALALHGATGHREGVAAAQGRLAVTAAWLGDYTAALREFDRALESYESIGNKRGLAVTHTNRTLLLMRLGAFEEALESIERSNALFEVANEQRTVVANRVNASFVRLHLGQADVAKGLALEALAAAKDIAFPVFEAAALANLGNAERALGEIESAAEHMEAGIAIRRPIQDARDFVDDLADLTMLYAQAGRDGDALATAQELFNIGSSSFEGAFWPHYVWWAAAIGFAAGGEHDRAALSAVRAGEELRRFTESIEDAQARESFSRRSVNATIARGAIPVREAASALGARR
jgi:tetratricopeptide (TPR) repeat protein